MSWPNGADPFYLANTTDNNARRTYYNVNSTPTQICDGTQSSSIISVATMQSRLTVPSHIWLDLQMAVNGTNLNVTAVAVTDVNVSGNVAIQIVLLDRYSYLPASPNGQPNHYHAMLKMAPTASGQAFSATAYDTVRYYATIPLLPSWQIPNLDVATFVQNNNNHEILQAKCEQVPVNIPGLTYGSYTMQDNGNNDGRAEPGETASMSITLNNAEPFQPATNVIGTLTTSDPTLNITTPTVNFPNIPNGGSGTNTNPFVFTVSSSATPHASSLHLSVVADPLQTTFSTDIPIYIGWPEVLVIDDDGQSTFETYYLPLLDSLDKTYEYVNVYTTPLPPTTNIGSYANMIWFTGYVSTNILTTTEQSLITAYLNAGGNLFINGQNIAQACNTSAPTFLHDVLHANFGIANTGIRLLNGVAGNPVGNGLSLNCNSGGSGSGSATNPDGISVLAPASEAFVYQGSTHRGGLTYTGSNNEKMVFFSFPFEAISGQTSTATRLQTLQAIFSFFGGSPPPPPNVTIDLVPINPPIQIPAGGGSFSFNATLHNGETTSMSFQAWIMQQLPNGTWQGPMLGPVSLTTPAGATITRLRNQNVPGSALAGVYTYVGYTGTYATVKWDSGWFNYTKLSSGDGSGGGDWRNTGESFETVIANAEAQLPETFTVEAYPNPFNPTTTLRFTLPEAMQVKLTVYEMSGREVAVLINGLRVAGAQEATFDASGLTSGIYLWRLTSAGMNTSGKMVLMK